MHKETLTLASVKRDLMIVLKLQKARKFEWRMTYIIPITAIAIILGVLSRSVVVGTLIFSTCIYQIVQFTKESKAFFAQKRELLATCKRRDISISIQKFSHISEELIYEPHTGARQSYSTKLIRVYYFESGASWRLPEIGMHYSWSKKSHLSTKGMEHLATRGSEFFLVRLQSEQDIAYIYPCKLFRPDDFLSSACF